MNFGARAGLLRPIPGEESMWSKKRLLIWGKTYPEFSKSYYETVCTGAVDGETGKLIRIYPISLRYNDEQFRLYDWIEGEVQRNTSDFRPESYKIKQDSIRVHEGLGPADGWQERREWVLRDGNVFQSVENLQAAEKQDHTSLGLVKPKEVRRIYVRRKTEADRQEWDDQRENALRQRELFIDAETKTKDLQFMPVQYRVCFTCDDPACSTEHDLSILDWGVYVLSRKAYARGGSSIAEKHVISKLKEITDLTKKDLYLFLGNTKQHCEKFMVVGFFYPPIASPKSAKTKAEPGSLRLPGFD
jgi:hypothetical protein